MKRRLLARLLLIAPVMGMAAGCAEAPLKFPPPSDMARARFGTVGVLPVRDGSGREELRELGADVARGELQGAIEGIKWAFEPAAGGCGEGLPTTGAAVVCAGTIVYGIVAAPVAAVVGAIRSRPASEVEAAERSLLAGFKRMNPRTALRDRIVLVGKSNTKLNILAIDDERRDVLPGGPTRIDSVMTLSFEPLLLFDDDDMNPGVTLEVRVTASIARAEDAAPLHTQIWRYRSGKEEFFDLADNGARRLEAVIAKAYERLAQKIVHDVFVASTPETQNPGQRGTAWAVDTSSFYDVATSAPTEGPDAP